MNLQKHYNSMRAAAFCRLTQGKADLDTLINSAQDTRRGITLLTRPPAPITAAIETVMADFQRAEPDQHYYPAADIHLTLLSIISCYSGFALEMIEPADYRQAVHTILQDVRPFKISFSGLTASPGAIIVQGFPQDEGLKKLRDKARSFFQQSELQQSIDQRYSIQTAHSTVVRFTKEPLSADVLVSTIKKYQDYDFGEFEVDTVELVYNDWYQRAANTVLLEKYSIGKG